MAILRNIAVGDNDDDFSSPECDEEIDLLAQEDLEAAMADEDGYEGWTCSVCDGPAPAGEPTCSDECEAVWQDALDRANLEERFQ